jgi:hypothetical protein
MVYVAADESGLFGHGGVEGGVAGPGGGGGVVVVAPFCLYAC